MHKFVLCVKCEVFVLHFELQIKHTVGSSQQQQQQQ